jgi:aminopeptidase N
VIRAVIWGIWILLLSASGLADTYIRQPSVDVLHYDISLELNDTSDSFVGTTRIKIRIRHENISKMWLDFTDMVVDKFLIQGIEKPFVYRETRLSFDLDRTYARDEIATVEVQYHGRPQNGGMLIGNNAHGRRVFFTDSWPDLAHHWFPSIDHPSDKAAVDVTVIAPEKYDVVSNGRMVKTLSMPDGRKLTHWSESRPIPTYSVAIGVAEFSITHEKTASDTPIALYSYPQDVQAAAQKFSRSSLALKYFESVVGSYPYEKLAQVEGTIREGAMENASAIFYSEPSFKGSPIPEFPVPHEIAHQWFGNSVTEADWDHLWLSEGFATYFDALFYEHLEGSESLKRIMASYARKLDMYASGRSECIIDPGQTDPMKKLSPINYEKGAWILHMLRGMLGDVKFFEGIRRYYRLHADGNALSEDFQKEMESAGGIELTAFFKQWLYQKGWPEYLVSWHWNAIAGEVELQLRQTQTIGLFDMPLNIAFSVGNRREVRRFRVTGETHNFRIKLKAEPDAIELDPNGWVLKSVRYLKLLSP